jgi:hypothetical protein
LSHSRFTNKWATFFASGITGMAKITATSIKRPKVSKSIIVNVHLIATPTMLCDGAFPCPTYFQSSL